MPRRIALNDWIGIIVDCIMENNVSFVYLLSFSNHDDLFFVFQRIIEAVSKDDRRSCYPLLIHSTDNDINTRTSDNQKMTPLHISCKLGNSVLVQLLLWVSLLFTALCSSPIRKPRENYAFWEIAKFCCITDLENWSLWFALRTRLIGKMLQSLEIASICWDLCF